MIKHYFTIAWRNLLKYKLYSFLNIAGLTVGILSFCYIFLFVKDELSYDNYFQAAERTILPGPVNAVFISPFDKAKEKTRKNSFHRRLPWIYSPIYDFCYSSCRL